MPEWGRRLLSALASWWRRRRAVNPWTPGHSTLERMRALQREMVWVEDDPTDDEPDLVVQVRVKR